MLLRLRYIRINREQCHKNVNHLSLTMSLPLPKGVKPAGHVDQDTLTKLGFSCDVETRPIPRKLEIDFVEVSMVGKSKSH